MASIALTIPSKNALVDELHLERRKIIQQALFENSKQYKVSILPIQIADIVADYVIDKGFFGAHEWRTVWGHDVDAEPELTQAFYKFWYGPDRIDPTQLACDTHLPLVLRPNSVIDRTNKAIKDYNLETLGSIMEKPLRGHPCRYQKNDTEALLQNGKNKAGPACWVTMRKGVFARNQPYPKQIQTIKNINTSTGACYEEQASALDLATVVSGHQALTKERYLGDETGAEGSYTLIRCGDTVKLGEYTYQVLLGGNSSLTIEGDAPSGLVVRNSSDCNYEHIAVAALLKYQGQSKV